MAEIKTMLDELIEQEIRNLDGLSSGSDGKYAAIQDLAALHKLRIEEIKAETEAAEVCERQFTDDKQFKDQTIDRYVRIGVAAAELILPLICYGVWMKKGFKFEETGTYTSATFKNLFNRFKPTRKS